MPIYSVSIIGAIQESNANIAAIKDSNDALNNARQNLLRREESLANEREAHNKRLLDFELKLSISQSGTF
jgi:hypothetical protein